MKKRTFMSGVAFAALAGALVASPAYASEGDAEAAEAEESSDDEFRLPAGQATASVTARSGGTPFVDTFGGFDQEAFSTAFEGSIEATISRYVGPADRTITPEIIVRTDRDINGPGVVDSEGDPNRATNAVVQMFIRNNASGGVGFNCTGTLINPRTVLTAAHCLNFNPSEAYGDASAAQSILVGTGFDTQGQIFGTIIDGLTYAEGGVATSSDIVIHPTANQENGGFPFPFADIAFVALGEPITDIPTLPLLLTPLTELTHVVQVGYGTFGDGLGGQQDGSPFLRRVGENMLGALASFADFDDVVFANDAPNSDFGSSTQSFYWTDFDWEARDDFGFDGCDFNGNGPECVTFGDVFSNDWFDGDALENEVATGPGDSGSPLIVDELYDTPVVAAVLSGGVNFFRNALIGAFGTDNTYGDISFYNPLYPFFEFISQNTAYKYVSAAEGDGVWSDASRWTQDLDPGFLIDDGTGTLINGLPEGDEPGIFETGPNVGLILGVDISEFPEVVSPFFPPEGTPNFGGNLPESSVLLGPGSTGFVPQNTDGVVGVAFANPAQYFEVHLNNAGTTTVDLDVTIDKLIIDNDDAGFVLPEAWDFTSEIEVQQLAGLAEINGTLTTPVYVLGAAALTGDGGTISGDVFFNVLGAINAGGADAIGSLTFDSDFVQTVAGATFADFTVGRRRAVSNDFYDVGGLAVLDGALVVASSDRRLRFGTEFTVLQAEEIDGDFSDVILLTRSPVLGAETRVENGEVIVEIVARSIRDLLGTRGRGSNRTNAGLVNLGASLDQLRDTRFNEFAGLFDIVDNASFESFGSTLFGLTPSSAFQQTFTANSFSQRFTGQIAQRTLALRGGSRAAGGFSAAGNASFAINGTTPAENGKVGFFGSASGVFINGGQPIDTGSLTGNFASTLSNGIVLGGVGANALEQASLVPAGELTVGADMQVSDGFSFGIAMSRIRSSELTNGALRPQEDTSESMAVYMTYSDGGVFADGYAGTADQQFGVQRAAQGDLSSLFRNAVGQSDGTQTFGGMRLGYAFDLAKGVEVGPVASIDYLRSDINGYSELGFGEFGLTIADRSFTSLGAKAGAMASFDIVSNAKTSVRAFGSVAYAHELADTADVVTAHFAGAPEAAFSIANQIDPQWVSVNAGAEMQVGANLTASVSVTSDMGRGILSNDQGQVSLNWRF